jgi:hypothetical protein
MKAETADYLAKARTTLADAQKIAALRAKLGEGCLILSFLKMASPTVS